MSEYEWSPYGLFGFFLICCCFAYLVNQLCYAIAKRLLKEIKTAAKEMPALNINAERMTAILDASNVTMQAIAVMGVFGALIAVLLFKKF